MKKTGLILIVVFGIISLYGTPAAWAAETGDSWKLEFETICAKTENPMVLTTEELKTLVERCDALQARIEKVDEAPPTSIFEKA